MDIVNLSEAQAEWNWLHELATGPEPLRWRHASTREVAVPGWVPKPQSWRRLVAANRAATMLSAPSAMLVSHGPRMTMYGSFALAARLRPRHHLAYAFNFTTLTMAASTHRVLRSAFRRIDRFVVFSTMERRLYADFFDLDIARFDMLHWSVKRPVADPVRDPSLPDAYVCSIGSQGRDYATLMAAMALLPRIRLVVVASPESLHGLSIPPNVTVRFNVPLPQTMAILQQARFSVVPLLGTEVPCGHVTLVSAMHLGKASIVSESTGIADYVQDHANGLTVPPFDPAALARAVEHLWNDAALNARLADQARAFAEQNCSEQSAVDYLEAHLRRATA
ncbi:MAG: glycosyltransferase family 4 protein [Pseudomonadota bacterium]